MTRFTNMRRPEKPTHIYTEGVTGFNLDLNGEATNIVDPQLTGKPKSRSWGTFLRLWTPYVRYILLAVSTLAVIAYAIRKLTPISLTDMDPNLAGEGDANKALPTLVVKPTLGPTLPNVLRLDTGLCSAVAVPTEPPAAIEVPEESETNESLREFAKEVYEEIKNLMPRFFRSEVKYTDLNGHEITDVDEIELYDEPASYDLREILEARKDLRGSDAANSVEAVARYAIGKGVAEDQRYIEEDLNSPDRKERLEAEFEYIHLQRLIEALEKNFLEVDLMQHLTNTKNYFLSLWENTSFAPFDENLGTASIPEEPLRTEIERSSPSISAY